MRRKKGVIIYRGVGRRSIGNNLDYNPFPSAVGISFELVNGSVVDIIVESLREMFPDRKVSLAADGLTKAYNPYKPIRIFGVLHPEMDPVYSDMERYSYVGRVYPVKRIHSKLVVNIGDSQICFNFEIDRGILNPENRCIKSTFIYRENIVVGNLFEYLGVSLERLYSELEERVIDKVNKLIPPPPDTLLLYAGQNYVSYGKVGLYMAIADTIQTKIPFSFVAVKREEYVISQPYFAIAISKIGKALEVIENG